MESNNIERGIKDLKYQIGELKSELAMLQRKHCSFANNVYLGMVIGGMWLLTILIKV